MRSLCRHLMALPVLPLQDIGRAYKELSEKIPVDLKGGGWNKYLFVFGMFQISSQELTAMLNVGFIWSFLISYIWLFNKRIEEKSI